MSSSDLLHALSATSDWLAQNWVIAFMVAFAIILLALAYASDVVVTDSDVRVMIGRYTRCRIPLDDIKSLSSVPLQWRFNVGPIQVYDSWAYDPRLATADDVTTIPFAKHLLIERKAGPAVIVTPWDIDKFKQDLQARWSAEAAPDAEPVIAARIAAEQGEKKAP